MKNKSAFLKMFPTLAIAMMLVVALPVLAAGGPRIATDKADYAPGEVVTLTGSGWQNGEPVHIFVIDADGQSWSHDSSPDPVAKGGKFTYQFQLPNRIIVNYTVTAMGGFSGVATTTFTDVNIGTYDQCSNDQGDGYPSTSKDPGCRWINGNLQQSNSTYYEGDATVQRLWLTAFEPGSTHSVTLKYGTTKAGKHAYDYLTRWDWSEDWITVADRCQGISGCESAAETPLAIPVDPNANGFDVAANLVQPRQFIMRGGTLNSASTPTIVSGTYAGDSETAITINFQVATSGSMCNTKGGVTTCDIALWFGAHVARSNQWASGGAGDIPGSPYHVALDAMDGVAVGSRDNQMASNAILPSGILQIEKSLNNPDGASVPASFTVNYDCGVGYTGQVTVTTTTPATVTGIPVGNVCTVSEVAPDPITGYTWGTISYSPTSVTISQADQTFIITVGNSITRDKGSLVLAKALTGGPNGYTGPFTIHYDCGTFGSGDKSVAAGSSQTVADIPTGTECTISEPTLPTVSGYTFGTPTFSPSATVTIPAGNGSSVTVTTNNTLTRDTGSLQIVKTVSNPDSATLPASFTVNYDCGVGYTGQVSVAPGSPATVNGIPTGNSCSVVEVAPAAIPGYTWGTITYTPASVVISTKDSTFSITVGNSITRDRGSLQIVKTLSNPDGASVPASFAVNYDCGTGYTGQVSVAPGSPATVNGIPTGNSCTVTEVAPAAIPGYSWGTITYTPASVTIDTKGGTFTITVGNSITRDRGNLQILKAVDNPDGATLPASFSVNYDCGVGYTGQVSVAPGSPATVNDIPTGNSCSVIEVTPDPISGYTWGTITYTPASVTIDTKGGTFSITVGNSITRDRGSLKITKTTTNPDGATLPASFTVNYDCGTGYTGQVSVASGGYQTVTGIPTGSVCTVTEVAPAPITGYTWGTITYTPASITIETTVGTFEIVVGNSITRDMGSLRIEKTLSNPDGASVPASFTVNYNCGSGYTGQVSVAPGSPATVNNIPTGNTCTVTEVAPAAIPGFEWGTVTYTPASVDISTKGGTFSITVANSITKKPPSALIAPTQTTCQMFRDGTANTLSEALYGIRDGVVNNVAPGVMFYYSEIIAPSADFTMTVGQSNDKDWKPIPVQGEQQIVLYNFGCTKFSGGTYENGTVTYEVEGATTGAHYIIGIMFQLSELSGQSVGSQAPSVKYTFNTSIEGTPIDTSQAEIYVKPK
jgi:hypothetical protein